MAIDLTFRDEIAVLTINRPEVLNALSFGLLAAIGDALDRVADSPAKALIVAGAGDRAFCAGADVAELTGRRLRQQRDGSALGQSVFAKLDTLPVTSIAAVDGYAFGGGMELALACSLRIATGKARFALPEIKLGLIPGYGGTQRLPRLIGQARALDMVLTGRTVGADEALAMGLVNRLVEAPILDAAVAYAREFTGHGQLALQLARDAIMRSCDTTLADGLRIESDLSTLAYQTRDAEEGMNAFLEKRAPTFEGR